MIPEQRRKILEAAAKACCYTPYWNPSLEEWQKDLTDPYVNGMVWNPIDNPADTAEMCAKLKIDWLNKREWVVCRTTTDHGYVVKTDAQKIEDHDNSRLKAWMFAATMVAAKIGGYKDES